jgi:hypothetical protein
MVIRRACDAFSMTVRKSSESPIASSDIANSRSTAQVNVRGVGQAPCSDWTQARHSNVATHASFLNWAQGYLTGFSAAVIDIKHLNAYDVAATQPDDAAMWAWLDNYCSNNPSMKLSQAVGALVGKLLNR